MAHDVFLSHSSKDRDIAEKVLHTLEDAGVKCWIAPRDIRPGVSWPAAIVKAIKESKILMLVFSADADASEQIKREVAQAVEHGLPLLPVRIQNVKPSADMAYFLVTPHWLEAHRPPFEDHLAEVVRTVQGLLNKPTASQQETPTIRPAKATATPARSSRGLLVGAAAVLLIGGALAAWQFMKPPPSDGRVTGTPATAPTVNATGENTPAIAPPKVIARIETPHTTPAVAFPPTPTTQPVAIPTTPGAATADPVTIGSAAGTAIPTALPTTTPTVVAVIPKPPTVPPDAVKITPLTPPAPTPAVPTNPKPAEPFELKPSGKVARLSSSTAAAITLGELVTARLNDKSKSGDAHYWSFDLPAGEYRIVVDIKPLIEKPEKPTAALQWVTSDAIAPLQVTAESATRFTATFTAAGPVSRTIEVQNTGGRMDYWLCVAPKDAPLPTPLNRGGRVDSGR